LLINQVSLLHPTFESCGRAHPSESLFPVQHLDSLAIGGESDLVEDLRELIAKHNLWRRHVIHFENVPAASIAGSQQRARGQREKEPFCGGKSH